MAAGAESVAVVGDAVYGAEEVDVVAAEAVENIVVGMVPGRIVSSEPPETRIECTECYARAISVCEQVPMKRRSKSLYSTPHINARPLYP